MSRSARRRPSRAKAHHRHRRASNPLLRLIFSLFAIGTVALLLNNGLSAAKKSVLGQTSYLAEEFGGSAPPPNQPQSAPTESQSAPPPPSNSGPSQPSQGAPSQPIPGGPQPSNTGPGQAGSFSPGQGSREGSFRPQSGQPGQSGSFSPQQRQFENAQRQFESSQQFQRQQFQQNPGGSQFNSTGNSQSGGFGRTGQQETGLEQFGQNQNTTFRRPEKLEVRSAAGGAKIDLEREGTEVRFEQENGKVVVKARKADGTEVKLGEDAFQNINSALGNNLPDIHKGESPNSFVLKRGGTEARTNLPISVDVTTGSLTVTTPAGVKTVTVLPDQAVQNLVRNGVLTNVSTIAGTSTTGATTPTQNVELTTLNDQPVFKVEGEAQERMFGFIPVRIPKTAFVSAEAGQVVRTDETFFNRLLDTFSF